MTAQVHSVNISTAKGTTKKPLAEGRLDMHGLVGDAHAGPWHRQVSLLAREAMDAFGAAAGRTFADGDFAENLTLSGLDLDHVALRDRLLVGEAELEITQIGKRCHGAGCAIQREVGACVMPKQGLFARVIRPGLVRPGDAVTYHSRPLRIAIITASDRASAGVYEDRSGPAIQSRLEETFRASRWKLACELSVVPDEAGPLGERVRAALASGCDALFTTGGTGIGPRDITPEVVRPLLDKELPGIMERIRQQHAERLPAALLSRSIAGVAGTSLVYCLPGSPKAVTEYLDEILRSFEHALLMLWALDAH